MTTIDIERQQQAKIYSRIKRRLWLIETVLNALYMFVWLFLGWTTLLRNWLLSFTNNEWLLVVYFAGIFLGTFYLLTLPLSYYSGFILPHRFGQSTQTFKDWILDQVKGISIGAILGLLLLELLYLALRVTGNLWWLWATGGLLLVNVLLVNLTPILIMPLFNKFVPLGDEHAELADRLIKLTERANTKVNGVFKMDMSRRTKAANAMLTGLGNTRRVILGDTLINEFSLDEVETVLAHELGHHVNKDIPILIAFGTFTTVIGFYLASLVMNWAVHYFGFSGVADVAAFPALMGIIGAYNLLLMPIENGFIRSREVMADEYALKSTGKNEAFASSLKRLANQNLSDIDPERWVVWLFYNHPPLNERIAMAENWKK